RGAPLRLGRRAPGAGRADRGGSSCCRALLWPRVTPPQQLEHPLRVEGQLADADAAGVVDRVRDRWNRGVQRALSRFLGAIGPAGVVALDDVRVEIGGIERSGDTVVEE